MSDKLKYNTLCATGYIYKEQTNITDWLIKGTEAKKDIMIIRDVIKGE